MRSQATHLSVNEIRSAQNTIVQTHSFKIHTAHCLDAVNFCKRFFPIKWLWYTIHIQSSNRQKTLFLRIIFVLFFRSGFCSQTHFVICINVFKTLVCLSMNDLYMVHFNSLVVHYTQLLQLCIRNVSRTSFTHFQMNFFF